MNITRNNVDALNAIVTIELAKEDFQGNVDKVLKNYKKNANIPGFRKGAVPMTYLPISNDGGLSEAQQNAYDSILASFREKEICLLHGVTSSGKTEIYIRLINKYLNEGKQVLYLLPEIALTTQITDRLSQVFGSVMGVYHSMFTDVQRSNVYRRQLSDNPYKLILVY